MCLPDPLDDLSPAELADLIRFNSFMNQYAKHNDTLEGVEEAYQEEQCSL